MGNSWKFVLKKETYNDHIMTHVIFHIIINGYQFPTLLFLPQI